ncbi:v-type proton atpase subunit a [Anaeramoeba ignava]|uniref:V-type proton ATPase subunit a n=1 Tax=Anaeramoeba ignava TaxID=1746090 RepID=A0A9Q0LI47_ANAIG|nr:v-type proton atpase subunit a [Anaeramoeba ignava]
MGSLLRSKEMKLIRILVQPEAAHVSIKMLGESGFVQFNDLNSHINSFQRPKVNEIKKCNDIERKIGFFESQLHQEENEIKLVELPKEKIQEIEEKEIDFVDIQTEQFVDELKQSIVSREDTLAQYVDLFQLYKSLEKANEFFAQDTLESELEKNKVGDLDFVLDDNELYKGFGELRHIIGVINRDDMYSLERILWRLTRGNCLIKHTEIEQLIPDLITKKKVEKKAFIIFYSGDLLGEKVEKFCQTMGAKLFEISNSLKERNEMIEETKGKLDEMRFLLTKTNTYYLKNLETINSHLAHWKAKTKKEKSINHIINMLNFDTTRQCLIAEAWCPYDHIFDVQRILKEASENSGALVPTILDVIDSENRQKPTYFETNTFTRGFHQLVESYGTALYGEVNPTPFTIITFPFCLQLCLEIQLVAVVYDGRYIILLMGLFSLYTGLLYNETFALPIDFFGTCWKPQSNSTDYELVSPNCVYPFGVDPTWQNKKNELLYMNSLKMKLSVVFGVSHMTLGIFLNLSNAIHFKRYVDVWCGFIPRFLFFMSFFGYMVFLLFLKWSIRWNERTIQSQKHGILLINTLIKFVISPGSVAKDVEIYPNQGLVQLILILVLVFSIPWMLLPKPFVLKANAKKKERKLKLEENLNTQENWEPIDEEKFVDKSDKSDKGDKGDLIHSSELELVSDPDQIINKDETLLDENEKKLIENDVKEKGEIEEKSEKEEKFQMGEAVVEQIIETIEFVLGSISNTASYLRLWALSLAHAQLSRVFWQKLVLLPLTTYSYIVFVGFAIWVFITIAVLMIMETFSALLHSLRLHWVEFQNKFYGGEGIKFVPFDFNLILKEEMDK